MAGQTSDGPKDLDLDLIIRDPEIQPRERLNEDAVAQYAEDMLAGIEFPPVVVYFDGIEYWLSQGFHRTRAAIDAGLETISAIIRHRVEPRARSCWSAPVQC
jgi:ParB-like chromosome segregation protein Spo0J